MSNDIKYLLQQVQSARSRKDHQAVIAICTDLISDRRLNTEQRAVLYDMCGHAHMALNNIEAALKAWLASAQLPNNPFKFQEYSNYIFYSHYLSLPPADILTRIKGYNDLFAGVKPYTHTGKSDRRKIRVGYISADFMYSVVSFFCYSMLKDYDRSRFEVYVYAACQEDQVSREFKTYVDVWRNIMNLPSSQAAALIYADELDILFDPSGHTADNCLPVMAYKPAPVQISGIGWFNTTGLDAIDYFLTDVYVDPPGQNDGCFTEKLLRLPHSHFCYMWHNKPAPVSPPPCLKNGYITFGTLNKFAKVTDEMLSLWGQILEIIPGSRLFLKGSSFDSESGQKLAMERLEKWGIEPARVILEGFSDNYLQAYEKIDIALDTFPYPGGATTCDALYMGVPVVTLVGSTHNSRFGYSLLENMGLHELCACNAEEYVAICVKLAQNTEKLVDFHLTIRRRMRRSPVMDDGCYMVELELLYERISLREKASVSLPYLRKLEQAGAWDKLIAAASSWLCIHDKAAEATFVWALLGQGYLCRNQHNDLQRSRYALQKALALGKKVKKDIRLEWLCYLSQAADGVRDFELSYECIHEASQLLPIAGKRFAAPWHYNVHTGCGYAALVTGRYEECEREYYLAASCQVSLAKKLDAMSSYLLASHYRPHSTKEIFRRQLAYGKMVEQISPLPPVTRKKKAGEKIRIGYLSPDFRHHAMFPVIYGLFSCRDGQRFEVVGYQNNGFTDAYTEKLRGWADEWYDISALSPKEAAKKIRGDNIDILVELASHAKTSGLPVLAYRPARIHISGLGSLCSTGMGAVDYYLTDETVDPPGMHDDYFTECPLYLPAQFSYAGRSDVSPPQKAPCMQRGYIQLAVMQYYPKITDEMLLVWKKIMNRLPTARLLLKSMPFVSDSLQDMAYKRLRRLGMPVERITLEAGDNEYMERMLDVDILLDTYPYPGGSTSLDALYMGVPVVTLYGERRNTRFCYGILKSIGVEELAADTVTGYCERVIKLAQDRELLNLLHLQIRRLMTDNRAMSPQYYTRNLEQAYLQIAEKQGIFI